VAEKHLPIDGREIRSIAREIFTRNFPEHRYIFPATTYRYKNQAFPDNRPEIESTLQPPSWR
jgi:hypothetical protein